MNKATTAIEDNPQTSETAQYLFPVADAHCDYLYYAMTAKYRLNAPTKRQTVTLERLKAGNVRLQFFAAWIDVQKRMPPLQQTLRMIACFHRDLELNKDSLYEYSPAHYALAQKRGEVGALLTIEGLGEACMGELDNLAIFSKLGVRAATLIWNDNNCFGYPAKAKKFGGSKHGLTKLGRDAVLKMNELGMAVDLSHLNDSGIDDVLSISASVPFASHSNARGAYDHSRSLSDEHIKEIARRGGVVGINFYYGQLTDNPVATIDDVVRQIDYVAGLAGTDCIAIGSDYDGMDATPEGLSHPGCFQNLSAELLKRGYGSSAVRGIMCDNLRRYIDTFFV